MMRPAYGSTGRSVAEHDVRRERARVDPPDRLFVDEAGPILNTRRECSMAEQR